MPHGSTVEDLLRALDMRSTLVRGRLSAGKVVFGTQVKVILNGRPLSLLQGLDTVLGDDVFLLPPVTGG